MPKDVKTLAVLGAGQMGGGIDQFCAGMANIRDVIPFPRTPRSAEL